MSSPNQLVIQEFTIQEFNNWMKTCGLFAGVNDEKSINGRLRKFADEVKAIESNSEELLMIRATLIANFLLGKPLAVHAKIRDKVDRAGQSSDINKTTYQLMIHVLEQLIKKIENLQNGGTG